MSPPSPSSDDHSKKKHWKLVKVFAGFVVIRTILLLKVDIKFSSSARMDETVIMSSGAGIMGTNNETTTLPEPAPAPAPVQLPAEIKAEIEVDNPENPTLWIHVIEWDEGTAGWRIALHDLLTLARLYNATLVEPCARNGRLLSCGRTEELPRDPLRLKLSDMLDVPALKEHVWPKIATFDEFVSATGYNLSWTRKENHPYYNKYSSSTNRDDNRIFQTCLCFYKRERCHSVEPPLSTTYYQKSQVAIQKAVQNSQTQTTILEIVAYRKHALKKMLHKGFAFSYYTKQTSDKMKQVGLPQGAVTHVQSMLQDSWNIAPGDPFAVLQWRPEMEPLDYQACATAILQARDHVSQRDGIPLENFILISPLSQHEELVWYGVKQYADRHNDTSYPALDRILSKGFKKLEQLSTFWVNGNGGVPDGGLLAVWDFVLAQSATTLSTCSGCNEAHFCSQCNYQGHSVEYLLGLRKQYIRGKQGVTTDTCWPEGDGTMVESSQGLG